MAKKDSELPADEQVNEEGAPPRFVRLRHVAHNVAYLFPHIGAAVENEVRQFGEEDAEKLLFTGNWLKVADDTPLGPPAPPEVPGDEAETLPQVSEPPTPSEPTSPAPEAVSEPAAPEEASN